MHHVEAFENLSPEEFRGKIEHRDQPAVLRAVASDWPLVRAAKDRPDTCMAMLAEHSTDAAIELIRTDPENEGRFHYTPDGLSLNFVRGKATLKVLLAALQEQAGNERPYAIAAQGVVADPVVPSFQSTHPMPIVPESATPRLWIGNAAKVATHNDPSDNIAVVVAGRRRFTLFPPDQISNLYLGPLHFTPAGTPISMVHVTAPDLDRYPRFAAALEAAQTAELEPGDAIFIPYAWYHHVEALEPFNMLVNYWWDPAGADTGSPWDAMMHGMLSIRSLPEKQRAAWAAMFHHYVFQTEGDPAEHMPDEVKGILGPVTESSIADMRKALVAALSDPQAPRKF